MRRQRAWRSHSGGSLLVTCLSSAQILRLASRRAAVSESKDLPWSGIWEEDGELLLSAFQTRRGQPSPACLGGKQEVLPGQPGSICHYLSAGPGGMSPMCAQEDGMGLSAGSIPTAPGAQLCPHVRSTSEFQEPLFFKDS